MKKHFKISLSSLWLMTSAVSLILPVFLPSYANSQNFVQNVIGTTTVSMFVLSLPTSLFGLPLLFFAQAALGVDPNSISGMYLNLILLFIFGLVQWFWIVPSILRNDPELQILDLSRQPELQLAPERPARGFEFFDSQSRSPVERVLRDEDPDPE